MGFNPGICSDQYHLLTVLSSHIVNSISLIHFISDSLTFHTVFFKFQLLKLTIYDNVPSCSYIMRVFTF